MNEIKKIEDIVKAVSKNVLMPYFNQVKAQTKQDGSLITQADMAVQKAIKSELSKYFPEYGFFAEELSEHEMNSFFSSNHSGYWCLDPLDGTFCNFFSFD